VGDDDPEVKAELHLKLRGSISRGVDDERRETHANYHV